MKVENNKVVTLSYSAYDNKTGVLLESSNNAEPLQFIIGKEHVVPGLEKEIMNLEEGDSKQFVVEAIDAYGEVNADAVRDYPIEQFKGINLKKGMTLVNQDHNGKQIYVKVAEFDDTNVTIDFNHPLSGKDIKFDVNILEIREATSDELAYGQVITEGHGCGCGSGCGCH